MREILFRGKRKDNGEWETGSLLVERMNTSDQQVMIADKMTGYPTLVLPETIGQYTGLKDKNGTKIFEGDILSSDKYPYTSDGKRNYFAEVVWFCPAFGLYTFKAPKSKVRGISEGSEFIEDNLSDMEVIGNVYDNQELLEEDKT